MLYASGSGLVKRNHLAARWEWALAVLEPGIFL